MVKIKKTLSVAVCGMTAAALSAAMFAYADDSAADTNGYEGMLTLTPGTALETKLGFDLETTTAKISSNGSSVTAAVSYGEQSLASIDANYDAENNRLYFRIPELSDDVLYVDLSTLSEDVDYSADISTVAGIADVNLSDVKTSINNCVAQLQQQLGVGDVGGVDGSMSDISYSYSSVTYNLSGAEMAQVHDAISEYAASDDTLVKLSTTLDYESTDDFIDSLFTVDESSTYELTLYFDDTDVMGYSLKAVNSDNEAANDKLIFAKSGTKLAFRATSENDLDGDEDDTSSSVSAWYSVDESGAYSGVVNSTETYGGETYNSVCNFSDLVMGDDVYKGTISYNYNDLIDVSATFDIGSGEDTLSATINYDGELYLAIDYTGKSSLFEGVTLDTEGAYNALDDDELQKYLDNADVDSFTENVKSVLGDDLYEYLFTESGSDDENTNDGENNADGENTTDGGDESSLPESSIDTDVNSNDDDFSSDDGSDGSDLLTDTSSTDDATTGTTSASTSSNTSSAATGTTATSSTAASKSSDTSPETGGTAAGAAALVLVSAAAVITVKRKH